MRPVIWDSMIRNDGGVREEWSGGSEVVSKKRKFGGGDQHSHLDGDDTEWTKMKQRKSRNRLFTLVSDAKKRAFLASYAAHGNIGLACKMAQINRASEIEWRKSDADYAAAFAEAHAEFLDCLVGGVSRRVMNGQESYKFFRGAPIRHPVTGQPYKEIVYPDKLTIAMLNYHVNGSFGGQNAGQPTSGPTITPEQVESDNQSMKEFFEPW